MNGKRIIAMGLAAIMILACAACGNSKGNNSSGGGDASGSESNSSGNLVVNGSFEEEELNGWTVNNVDGVTDEVNLYQVSTDASSGVQSFHFYSSNNVDFTLEQTITDVESGTYKLSCKIQGDGAVEPDIYLYAVIDGEVYKAETSLNGYLTWNSPEISDLNVENGTITIGMSVTNGPGGWGTIDDFVLEKQ